MKALAPYRFHDWIVPLAAILFFNLLSNNILAQNGKTSDSYLELSVPQNLQQKGFQASIAAPAGSSTCGIDDGETPFTVSADVITNFNGSDVSCQGADDAEACATVSGGVGPFTYQWFGVPGSNTDPCVSGLGAGTYSVLIEDLGQGILCATTVEVSEPSAIALFDLNIIAPTCDGVCNGSVNAIPLGGTGAYTILWNGNPASSNISDVCQGENNLVISDANGCTVDSTFTIELNAVEANLVTTDILCFGDETGGATASPAGGTGSGYVLTWSNGDTGNIMSNEPAGDYVLTIDDNGCINEFPFTLTEEEEIDVFTLAFTDPNCPDLEDGAIQMAVQGGVEPYTYAWTGPNGYTSDQEDISDLAHGIYQLEVTDANGCLQLSNPIELQEAPQVEFDPIITDQSCEGLASGAIQPQISGGFPPYTNTWTGPDGFSSDQENISDLLAGTYDLMVVDNHGCESSASFEVDDASIDVSSSLTQPLCQGDATGEILLTVTGGTEPYNYLWTGPIVLSNSPNQNNLPEGSYSVAITDAANCTETFTFEVEAPNPIEANALTTPAICDGEVISIDLSPIGGVGNLTVEWEGPNGFESNNEDVVDGEPGIYELTISDEQGCEYTETFDLSIANTLTIGALLTDPDCTGANNGAIDLAISGGVAPYTIVWSGQGIDGVDTEDVQDLDEGMYSVTVTDSQNCEATEDFELVRPEAIAADIVVTSVLCFGENSGAISTTVTGANNNFTYTWTGPDGFTSASPNPNNLFAGEYALTIVDGDCTFNGIVEVPQPDPINVVETNSPESCAGNMDGSIELLLEGGVNPFVIEWNGPGSFTSNDEDISDLEPGNYAASISDENGCSSTFETSVDPGTSVTVDFFVDNTQCGESVGEITAFPTGGEQPYSLQWEDEEGNDLGVQPTISQLAAGVYTVSVTELGGCEVEASQTVSDTEASTISAELTHPSCPSDSDGGITLEIEGDFPPFTVVWSDPINSDQLLVEDLPAGTYSVSVSDDLGCESSAQFTLVDPEPLDVNADIIDELCAGAPGAINVIVSGGTQPYSFDWQGPNGYTNDTEDILGIAAGMYALTVTDANACTFLFEAEVIENTSIEIILESADQLCPNSSETGGIDVTVEGGVPPYNFSWSDGIAEIGMGEDLSGFPVGSYILTVTDADDCVQEATFEIEAFDEIVIELESIQPDCGLDNGSLTADPSAGLQPYTFVWNLIENGNATFLGDTESISDLASGTYEVVVSDANGCSNSATIDLSSIEGEITADITQPTCFGEENGAIDISATGVTLPLDFSWEFEGNEIATTEDLENIEAGVYTLTITDANDCVVPATIEVLQPDELELGLAVTPAGCDGTPIGSIMPGIGGGTEPYTFAWTGPNAFESEDNFITNLLIGDYEVTITDAQGCSISANATVELAETLEVVPTITDIACNGALNGAIALQTFNGEPEIEFDWSGPNGFTANGSDIDNLEAGQYDVVISDQSNCLVDTFFVVGENPPFETLVDLTQPPCFNNLGSIELQAFSTTGSLTVTWTGPDNFTSDQFDLIDVAEGDYTYTLSDALGCTQSETFTLTTPEQLDLELEAMYGDCSANLVDVQATVLGGTADFTFNWFNQNGFSSDEQNLSEVPAAMYTLQVTDANDCQHTETIIVEELEPILLVLDSVGFTPCVGANEGWIEATASGGNSDLSYSWTGPDGYTSAEENATELFVGNYTLVVSDDAGCTTSISEIEIIVESDLAVSAMADSVLCLGPEGILVTGEAIGAESVFWTDMDENVVSESTSFTWTEPGQFSFVINAKAGVCLLMDTVHLQLNAAPLADAGQDLFLFPEEIARIGGNPISEEGNTIVWTPDDNFTDNGNGNFEVEMGEESVVYALEVTSAFGCVGRDTVLVSIVPELVVPTGFSPNGDGINDVWDLQSWQLYPSMKIAVYNRWGDQLFFSDQGYPQPWDGKKDGKNLPVGTYYYVIDIDEPTIKTTLNGPVTLLE